MVLVTKQVTSVNTLGSWTGTPATALADGSDATYTENAAINDVLYMNIEDITETSTGALVASCTAKSRWDDPTAGTTVSRLTAFINGGAQVSPSQGWSAGAQGYNYAGWTGIATVGIFNASLFGGEEINYITVPARFTKLELEVDFIPPAGSWASFAGMLVGLLGSGIGTEHMAQIARHLHARRKQYFHLREYTELLAGIREPRRRYAF